MGVNHTVVEAVVDCPRGAGLGRLEEVGAEVEAALNRDSVFALTLACGLALKSVREKPHSTVVAAGSSLLAREEPIL
jgi:hypothetical protein